MELLVVEAIPAALMALPLPALRRTSWELRSSARAILFPLHPQYPVYLNHRPAHNGSGVNADVYGDGGPVRAPWGSCGVC